MATMPKPALPVKRIEHFGDPRDEMIVTTLSKGKREEVEFFSKRDIRIAFDTAEGSPFQKASEFLVKAGQTTPSGPLRQTVAVGEHYHYHVHAATSAGPSADPTIIIQE